MNKVYFEASPTYLFFSLASSRIAEVIPSAKIIILLREPVSRAWSHYQHNVKRMRRENRSFETAIEEDIIKWKSEGLPSEYKLEDRYFSYIRRGIYVEQIKKYMKYFGEESILIIKSEDMFNDPQQITNCVCSFLDLPLYKFKKCTSKKQWII